MRRLGLALSFLVVACGAPQLPPLDGGAPDAGHASDAGGSSDDAGAPDAGHATDAGGSGDDAGAPDAGHAGDAGGSSDDGGAPDAGQAADAGGTGDDAGAPDAGPADAGTCHDFGCTSGACCDATCVDTTTSLQHCGGCGLACTATAPNTEARCAPGGCTTPCQTGFLDCDQVAANGCEVSSGTATACACAPGQQRACYTGPAGTEGVGTCQAGTQVCAGDGLQWGACQGEVTPRAEVCANGIDENCSGTPDDSVDEDGDGYGTCSGDCCDGPACPNAVWINAGAFDVPGNSVDDDCDGAVDNAVSCDGTFAFDSADAADSARALGLCVAPSTGVRKPGLRAAAWRLSSGTGQPAAAAHAIRTSLGANLVPREGTAFLVMSTGTAAAPGQPGFGGAAMSTNHTLSSAPPADWRALNGDIVPVPPGCPSLAACTAQSCTAFDPVMFDLTLRAPTNALAFQLDLNFLTSDYPEQVCGPYADTFLALLTSGYLPTGAETANPADGNLATVQGRLVSANLAAGNSGHFQSCVNGPTGCDSGATGGTYTMCTGTGELAGSGFDVPAAGRCHAAAILGGGTGWRVLQGNVVPGEELRLRLVLWDTGDGAADSTVVLDHFQWLNTRVTPGM